MFFSNFLLIILITVQQNNGNPISIRSLNKNCTVEHENHLLHEDEKVSINGKQFKVESCQLQRAYQTCGTRLWLMLNIVCGALDTHKDQKNLHNHMRRFVRHNLLSETCCENSCAVAEMSWYCP